jgi:hypothetical protein
VNEFTGRETLEGTRTPVQPFCPLGSLISDEYTQPRVNIMCLIAFLATLTLLASSSAFAQTATPSRSGPRILLPREREVALARSAAPASVSAKARVLMFTDSGFVVADSGSNGVTCVVNRSWPQALEPQCYDAEGAASVMPQELRRAELGHRGTPAGEIEREIAAGIASGRFRVPRRPALTYMMSAAQVLYDDNGKHVGAWRPHLMVYFPYLTNSELGLASTPDLRVGTVSSEGTPGSSLVIVIATAVTPSSPR